MPSYLPVVLLVLLLILRKDFTARSDRPSIAQGVRVLIGLEREQALSIIKQHGRSSLAHFCLLPDKSYYFSPTGKTAIAYVAKGRGASTLGDPIGAAEDLKDAIIGYKEFCDRNNWYPAFDRTLPDNLDLYSVNSGRFGRSSLGLF